jgi:hypothetical protein
MELSLRPGNVNGGATEPTGNFGFGTGDQKFHDLSEKIALALGLAIRVFRLASIQRNSCSLNVGNLAA